MIMELGAKQLGLSWYRIKSALIPELQAPATIIFRQFSTGTAGAGWAPTQFIRVTAPICEGELKKYGVLVLFFM
jgi:hypothetical protein